MQWLSRSRKLNKGEIVLRVGNGAKVAALAVGTYCLALPTGKSISLNNCYFVPVLIRNIISIPMLDKDGFDIIIKNNSCFIYNNNVLYGIGILRNGLYILDLHENILQIEQTSKRKRDDINHTYSSIVDSII